MELDRYDLVVALPSHFDGLRLNTLALADSTVEGTRECDLAGVDVRVEVTLDEEREGEAVFVLHG